jgi:hypothetical protein
MRFIRDSGLALVLLVLAGCNTLSTAINTTVSPNQIYILGNSFVAVEKTATQYLTLPPCPVATNVCRTPAGVNTIVPAIRSARAAVAQLNAYVSKNPGSLAPVSLYDTAVAAVTAVESAVTLYAPQSKN